MTTHKTDLSIDWIVGTKSLLYNFIWREMSFMYSVKQSIQNTNNANLNVTPRKYVLCCLNYLQQH